MGNSGHFVYLSMAALLLGVQEGLGVLDNVLADSDKAKKIKVFFSSFSVPAKAYNM